MGLISYYIFLYITEISLTSAKYLQKTSPPSVCLLPLRQRPAAFSSSRVFCWQKWIPALGWVMLRAQGSLGTCRALAYVIPPWMSPSRAQLGRAGDKIKPLLRLSPAWSRQHHHKAPLLLHALAFCFPFCPGDKVRMPKPLVQQSSGIWVSFLQSTPRKF